MLRLQKGFKPAKCKTALKLAVSRIKLMRNKKQIQLNQMKRDVAKLLETGQDQTARIRVEHVIREEKTIAAYDLLDIYCELIVARMPIIEEQKSCPLDLKEAVACVIFASPRCSDIQELKDICKHFTTKYGKEFVAAAIELRPDCGVNRTFVEKLSINPPDGPTKVRILTGIAEEHNIKWEPNWFKDEEPVSPASVPNAPSAVNSCEMRGGPFSYQATSSYGPKHEISSNTNSGSRSEVNSPTSTHTAARPPGTEPEKDEIPRSSSWPEDANFVGGPRWNMNFTDASAAAHVAAESAELASIAARAAARLASRGQYTNQTSVGRRFVQNEANINSPDQSGQDNSFHEIPSTNESTQQYPNHHIKNSAKAGGDGSRNRYNHSLEDDRPGPFQQPNSPMKVSRRDANDLHKEKASSFEGKTKGGYRQSLEQYDKARDYEDDNVSYAGRHHHDSVDHTLNEEAVPSRNQPSSYRSQTSGLGDNYGIKSNMNTAKYDSDPNEDPFESVGQGSFYKEDVGAKEPSWPSAFNSNASKEWKSDVLEPEVRKHGLESHSRVFVDAGDRSMHMDKESSNHSTRNAAPKFDDYVADEDDYNNSPSRKSPVYSSPDEDQMPRKWGISSSRHLYQAEFSESFKNSSVYSQLSQPVNLGDDSDEAGSEKDEEVHKSNMGDITSAGKVIRNYWEPVTDHREHDEFDEQSTAKVQSEETLEKDFVASRSTRSKPNAKSVSRQSFSRLLDEAERLSSPRTPSLQETADEIDDSYTYQYTAEGSTELNVQSLPGGLRNKGYKKPPYTKDTSTYSSSSSMYTADDTPRVNSSSSEVRENSSLKESNSRKKLTSRLDSFDDTELKGSTSFQETSIKRNDGNVHPRSRAPESFFDSEDISSQEEAIKQTASPIFRSGTGFSRRTRASGQSGGAGQMDGFELRRAREEGNSRPSNLSKMSSGNEDEISASLPTREQATSSKTLSTETSDKKATHTHPKLPDSDDFDAHFLSLRKNRQQSRYATRISTALIYKASLCRRLSLFIPFDC